MMTEAQRKKCSVIIKGAAIAAGGIGALPIPGSDSLAIKKIQIGMISQLAEVFGCPATEIEAEMVIKHSFAKNAGMLLSSNLIRAIPGADNVIRGVVAACLTEAIGWQQAEYFASTQF